MKMEEWKDFKHSQWINKFFEERITAHCPGCNRDIRVLAWRYQDGFKMFYESHQCRCALQDIVPDEEARIRSFLELQK